MTRDTFLKEENWHGSYYELCIELGKTGNNTHLAEAIKCFWSQSQLKGGWWERTDFMADDVPSFEVSENFSWLRYGIIQLQNGSTLGCVMHVVREENGSDWLDLCIPTGMLGLDFSIKYPIYESSNPWREIVDKTLIDIGVSIYQKFPFSLALIGEEASGITNANSLHLDFLRDAPALIPKSLWDSISTEIPGIKVLPDLVLTGFTTTDF